MKNRASLGFFFTKKINVVKKQQIVFFFQKKLQYKKTECIIRCIIDFKDDIRLEKSGYL